MQQTTTYKLNKPESTDTFSVSPLNENADKLEAQLARLDGADAAETAARQALDLRVTALEANQILCGFFNGTGQPLTINLGVTPLAVIVFNRVVTWPHAMAVNSKFGVDTSSDNLIIVDNGFWLRSAHSFNEANTKYCYIAFI